MAEGASKTEDSPASRLRPRSGAPKSYYEIRLEYSANPAAFTRERPRNLTRQKGFSTKTRVRPVTTTASHQHDSKRARERAKKLEEKRANFRRDRASSITSNAQMSPFMERILVNELKPSKIYSQNYIVLQIKQVELAKHATPKGYSSVATCMCESIDHLSTEGVDNSNQLQKVKLLLYDEYSNETLLKPNKYIGVGKFKTGPLDESAPIKLQDHQQSNKKQSTVSPKDSAKQLLPYSVIAQYDENCLVGTNKIPLMPFVNITDMIEQPSEPYVEMSPPTP